MLRASIRLRPVSSAWIEKRTLVAANISQTIELFEQSHASTYSVAWIDCLTQGKFLGRSLVMLGEHAARNSVPSRFCKTPLQIPPRRKFSIPLEFPSGVLNNLTVRTFNYLYYWKEKRKPSYRLVNLDSFFYPLDAIIGWNKIYGRSGFAQFQCVLPMHTADVGLRALLSAIASSGAGSFLAVLKRLGSEKRVLIPSRLYTSFRFSCK